jgi:hypothetical protein
LLSPCSEGAPSSSCTRSSRQPLVPVLAYEPPQHPQRSPKRLTAAKFQPSRADGTRPVAEVVSAKRHACISQMVRSSRDASPLKVPVPEHLTKSASATPHLNPELPVKKRPPFPAADGDLAARALQKLDPTLPVKKLLSTFLVAEPPYVLPVSVKPR